MNLNRVNSSKRNRNWYMTALFALACPTLVSAQNQELHIEVSAQQISTGNRFQAVKIVDDKTIFVSGTNSSIYKSEDAGFTWLALKAPAKKDKLQFRDVYADPQRLVLMSAGEGAMSRVYVSKDNGLSWQLTLQGHKPTDFYNCITEANQTYWLYGDSVNSNLTVFKSTDDANSWQPERLPYDARALEGGFASSGTCINSSNRGDLVIATGNTIKPRLLIKEVNSDWQSVESPFKGGEAAGIFSVQLSDNNVYAFGGTLKTKDNPALAYQYNIKQESWVALPNLPINGAIYGSAINQGHIFATSPDGIAMLKPNSPKWQLISSLDMWAIDCTSNYCIAVGGDDTVVKITF
ncbi:hypothetical protein [Psychrosphaera aestuarii]|uniref:hypothetical protein n=1 Tax=Psychrosphaera aestuarii TaxID=1266052 RepID=UPI001B325351|nr:hypothetical protein [Psychrosphaera aestuarii]